jgi:hypothetical protein
LSNVIGDSPLFNRFGSDPDKTKQEVDDSSKVIGDSPLFEKFSSDTDMEVDDLSKIGDNSPPLKFLDVVGRQVMRSDGVYVDGSIQGIKVTFTADTGAARTVISSKLFRKIPNSKKPRLERSSALASVNGQPLTEMGKAVFNITLGNLTLDSELIVAEIEDEALLGLDILMKGKGGPADIKLTEGLILLDGIAIPCTQIGQPEPVRKITAADDFIIPPRSEVIIDVFVDKFHSDNLSGPQNYLLEPNNFFVEKYPVAMASCLVDITHEVTNKVRLMNPFDHEVEIRQDTVLGEAEKVECPPVSLFAEEDGTESNNFDNVKRIKLVEQKPVTWPTNVGIIRNITKKGTSDGGKSGIVPQHLENLFNEAVQERSPEETIIIAELLQKFSDTFSKNDTDLGLTNLVEHHIETGDAKPLKQPPRRVPMAYAEDEKKLINTMQRQGIIQKSSSPWSSPLVLVMKKNGKIRPCV